MRPRPRPNSECERMDRYGLDTGHREKGETARTSRCATVREAISYYLPVATLHPQGHGIGAVWASAVRVKAAMVPRSHGLWLGWALLGGDLGLSGRTVFSPTAERGLVKRLPSPAWESERYHIHLWHFLPEKNGNWSAGSKASYYTIVEANGKGPAWWCGGWLTWCQVLRYQIDLCTGREFIERPESLQPDAEEGRKPPRNPRIEILSESRASCDSTGDVGAPSCWARRNTDLRGREACPPTAVQEVATPC